MKFHAGDFSLEDAPQLGRPVEIDSNQDIHWEQSMLCLTRESQHTQNIQINKVLGKNEKCVSYFMEKTIQTF